eukprot:TRINITY_DN11809_c0_g1_i1.p2 TRINITY_DN11809_c0_g1~~TRINITY_DN11809_c0_g1_i1.p2  ORF type:complete len:322 (-),score=153.18 TRINITY_DN11809_c0_g1_i1:175-1116(-)
MSEDQTRTINLNSRMYEQKYPEVDDLVMICVKSIAEMGSYVSLLEYNNIEGMILLSELSRRRIRSITKLIRVGRIEVAVVLRVDQEKGYIDLSKRRVSPEDVSKCEEKYNKSKAVHSIMRHVAELSKSNTEDLYQSFGWPLYKKFGHAYDAFKLALDDPSVLDDISPAIEPEVKEILLKDITRRLTRQAAKLRADFEVTCFHYEGIDAIKTSLKKAQDLSTPEIQIKIRLVAPPLFVMVTVAVDKEKGIALLNQAIDLIREDVGRYKGAVVVKMAPTIVSDRDDSDLALQLEQLERQSKQVSGDDDNSDQEDE